MKNTQKRFVPIILMSIIAVAAIGFGGYYYWQTHREVCCSPDFVDFVKNDWKKYTNTEIGISFEYPSQWESPLLEQLHTGSGSYIWFNDGLRVGYKIQYDAQLTYPMTIDEIITSDETIGMVPYIRSKRGFMKIGTSTYPTFSYLENGGSKTDSVDVYVSNGELVRDVVMFENVDGKIATSTLETIIKSLVFIK